MLAKGFFVDYNEKTKFLVGIVLLKNNHKINAEDLCHWSTKSYLLRFDLQIVPKTETLQRSKSWKLEPFLLIWWLRPNVWNFNFDLESEMDDAFARLEDISVEQTLQRLESLFDSSDHFPQVRRHLTSKWQRKMTWWLLVLYVELWIWNRLMRNNSFSATHQK